ncbi:putative lipid II flippase MurJ [Clostridia bacterium]|nr:putative lipid II flippase MurJ [Clostridia bacterium]
MTLAYAFGRSVITDAFVNAYAIPNLILSFIVAATATTYIPVYSSVDADSQTRFTNTLLTLFAIIGLVLSLAVFTAPQIFLKLVAWTAATEVFDQSLILMRYMAWAMIPMLICSILAGNLQAKSKFFIATAYQLFINAVIVVGILVAKITSIIPWIGIGVILGNLVAMAVIVYANRDLRYRPILQLNDLHVKRFFILLAPIMLSSIVGQLNTIITQNVANSLENHAVSTLGYANKVQGVFTAFIGTAVGTAFFPAMSKTASEGDLIGLKDQIRSSLRVLLPILIPLTIGILFLAEPIIRILLERGQFNPEDTALTATALQFVIFAMFAANINQMLSRGFFAMQKTKLPAIISVFTVLLNVICILIFVGPLQYRGLALATSISGMASMVAYYVLLKKELGSLIIYKVNEWIKLVVATAVLTIIVIGGRNILPLMTGSYLTCLVSLVGLVGVSVIVYAGLLIVMKTEIAGMVIDMVKNRGKKTEMVGRGCTSQLTQKF